MKATPPGRAGRKAKTQTVVLPAKPRPQRGRPRSLAAEQAILNATLQILASDGYSSLTLDRVAAMARSSKTTLYRRWPTKEHLVLAVFQQLPVTVPVDRGSIERDLVAMFGQFAEIMQHSPLKALLPMLVAECVGNPALASALILVNDQRRAPMRLVLNRAIRRGELAPDTDVELAIDVIQGAVAIRLYFLLDEINPTWVRKLARMVLNGIGVKPPARTRAR